MDPSIPAAYSPGQMPDSQQTILDFFFQTNNDDIPKQKNDIKFTD